MATFKIILYKQKILKDNTHPVVLQVIHNSKPTKISLGYKCAIEQWDFEKEQFKRSSKIENYKLKNSLLRKRKVQAEETIDKINQLGKPFTPQLFRELFTGVHKEISVYDFFNELMEELKNKGSIGNKNAYKDTRNAIQRFWGSNKTLMFPDVNYNFLKKFETFLFKTGCSGGGISFYMRTLRAAINEAIKRGFLDKELYPFNTSFNKNGYSLAHLKSTASPRALSIDDMDKFKNFDSNNHRKLEQSYLFFLFSYYSRGMNFKDMALLKSSNIYNGRINYTREKTGKFMTIKISENLQNILNHFEKNEMDHIFPILNDYHKTPTQIKNRVKKQLKKLNADLKDIAHICDIDAVITSYVARHTFANTLKNRKADIELISESLGHADISTTKAYLKKFENTKLDTLDSLL